MSNKTVSVELLETSKQLAEVQETNKTLGQDIVSLREQLATANQAVETGKTELTRLATEIEAKDKAIQTATAEIKTLKEAVATAEKSASAKAADIIASQGCPPVAGLNVPVPTSPADLMAEFQRITDPKTKTEFYRKHRAVLDPK